MAWGLGLAAFALALWGMAPSVSSVRDSGEMATVAHVLGVAHPPGYPGWTLSAHLVSRWMPWGNPAYRANVHSAMWAAIAIMLAAALVERLGGGKPRPYERQDPDRHPGVRTKYAISAAALVALGPNFRLYAAVAEKYAPLAAWTLGLILLTLWTGDGGRKRLALLAMTFGLSLGYHGQIALLLPAVATYLWMRWGARVAGRAVPTAFLFAALGFAVCLYLPCRSVGNPVVDWVNPERLDGFLYSLQRKGSGTGFAKLDLVAAKTDWREVAGPQLRAFGRAFVREVTPLGAFALAVGVALLWRQDRAAFVLLGGAAVALGPLFLLLARMPDNPYAMAIMGSHYVPAFAVMVVWGGAGLNVLRFRWVGLAALGVAALWSASRLPLGSQRQSWEAEDYARAALMATPRGATLGAREDPSVFPLLYALEVRRARPDVALLPLGLANAAWFRTQFAARWPDRTPSPSALAVDARTGEGPRALETGAGLVWRGARRTTEAGQYFDERTVAYLSEACLRRSDTAPDPAAQRAWLVRAARWDPGAPMTWYRLGALAFQSGDLPAAEAADRRSVAAYQRVLVWARDPALARDLSGVHANLGVVAEKRGDFDGALAEYRRAQAADPGNVNGWYNASVVYWRRSDWPGVVACLEQVLRIQPDHAAARTYLAAARARMSPARPGWPPGLTRDGRVS